MMPVGGLHPTKREAAVLRKTDMLMGYGSVSSLVILGAAASLIIVLLPVSLYAVNAILRFIARLGNPYPVVRVGTPWLDSLQALLPDVLMLILFGAILAYLRMRTTQTGRFRFMQTQWGPIRVGLDDLFGLLVGTPMIAFMFYRHDVGVLFFITGAENMLWPVLGYILAKVWEMFYAPLVRRFIELPLTVEIPLTIKGALSSDPRITELYRVHQVEVEPRSGRLVIRGKGSHLYRTQKGEEFLREVVRHIPIVKEHVRSIQIVDGGGSAA